MDVRLRVGRVLAVGVVVAGLVAGVPATGDAAAGQATYLVGLRAGRTVPPAGAVVRTYEGAFRGFSARLSQSQVRALAADPAVAYVVPDTPVHALGQQPNPPSWGLDRIDQRSLPRNQLYTYANTADTVTAYVIDTGIRATHVDFGGRVSGGVDFADADADDDTDDNPDDNPDDGNGHGTFIAGIIGGTRYGVAKKIRLVPVRVLNDSGSGTTADVIAGINWVTRFARKPAVVNMSLGGPANLAMDDAVRAAIASGVTFVVPSGSSASDAANFSPARVVEAITTSATQQNDCAFPPSNFGPVVDLYAPGALVDSDWSTSDTATITLSGTSFSSPHVVGGAALYLATHPTATPAQVARALIAASTKEIICNVPPNTANRLLYTGP
jgi:subtilisin family serine protease